MRIIKNLQIDIDGERHTLDLIKRRILSFTQGYKHIYIIKIYKNHKGRYLNRNKMCYKIKTSVLYAHNKENDFDSIINDSVDLYIKSKMNDDKIKKLNEVSDVIKFTTKKIEKKSK